MVDAQSATDRGDRRDEASPLMCPIVYIDTMLQKDSIDEFSFACLPLLHYHLKQQWHSLLFRAAISFHFFSLPSTKQILINFSNDNWLK